jgi:predicted ATP-dependent protease
MAKLVDYLRSAIPGLFESDEYRAKAEAIQHAFSQREEAALKALGDEAESQKIFLLRTPSGFTFVPTRDGEVIPPDDFNKLPDDEKQRIGTAISGLQDKLGKILEVLPRWRKERAEQLKQLNQDNTLLTVKHALDDIRARFADVPAVLAHLDVVQQDMVEHVDDFKNPDETTQMGGGLAFVTHETFHRYQVNVLVTQKAGSGAPVVTEDNPTYGNLMGRIEHLQQFGALVTDFTLIQAGALHRANGGYLLLDVRKLLMQPFAWESLKRAMQSREIRLESLAQMYSLVSTVSLEPEPIPLHVKVVLFGDRLFYYLLQEYDPDFGELFKVSADFEDRIERNPDTHMLYARMVATLTRKDKLLPFDRSAVARVIDFSSRMVEDAHRLSTHIRRVADLMREADYWARQSGHGAVAATHVQQAMDAQIRRHDRVRSELNEAILRGIILIDTQGAVQGQVNGLSVLDLGDFAFGQPSRITAITRLGEGEVLNIEREVKLSGALHSKGVLILSSFLGGRYARNQPLSLSASLVFEQSYGHIDGDSASLAETCALLSDLAQAPIRQSLAVTGSINQLGQVQAIGGVNEKIEGFFDICVARGLSGEQGVLIPASNVQHLMLRHDVVDAVAAGRFHVWAVESVDQAITLLTGIPAGEPDAQGEYPSGSVNQRVMARLKELTELWEEKEEAEDGEAGDGPHHKAKAKEAGHGDQDSRP